MTPQQQQIDDHYRELQYEYWTPHEILARLMEETGEVARIINRVFGPKKSKPGEDDRDLEGEVGDILFTLACLANRQGFDLNEALQGSIEKSMTRDKGRFASRCRNCEGTGFLRWNGGGEVCDECQGSGKIEPSIKSKV